MNTTPLGSDSDALRRKYREERDRRLRPDGNARRVETAACRRGRGARDPREGSGDLRIVEKRADFGGTCYWTRYPDAQRDIESYTYLPAAPRRDRARPRGDSFAIRGRGGAEAVLPAVLQAALLPRRAPRHPRSLHRGGRRREFEVGIACMRRLGDERRRYGRSLAERDIDGKMRGREPRR